jgi:hypothetical protein
MERNQDKKKIMHKEKTGKIQMKKKFTGHQA